MKELRVFAIIADEKILPAVVVIISDRETAADTRGAKILTLRFGCVYEISLARVAVELFFFFVGDFGMIRGDVVEDVAVDDEQIAPAVVIEIEKSRAEGAIQKIGLADAGCDRVVGERAIAIIAIEAVEFVIEMADEKVRQAVVGDVRRVGAHACFGAAFFAEAGAGCVRHVLERPVALIDVKKVSLRVVGDKYVRPAVIVQVDGDNGEALAVFIGEAGFFGYVAERAVAIIVIEARGSAGEIVRVAIGAHLRDVLVARTKIAAGDGVIHVVFHVVGDEQIKLAIVIVVEPCGGGGPVAIVADSRFFGDVGEGAVAVVVP